MKRLLVFVLVPILSTLFWAGLGAQEPSAFRAFSLVPLAGSGELDRALSDPRIGIPEKRLAIQRLGQLAG